MLFRIENIDVITRRNKKDDSCINDWKYYDYHFIRNWMKNVGCQPTHWKFQEKNGLPVCTNTSQMKQFSNQPSNSDVESFSPPCKVIERLHYSYKEHDIKYEGYILMESYFI